MRCQLYALFISFVIVICVDSVPLLYCVFYIFIGIVFVLGIPLGRDLLSQLEF